MKKLSLIGFAMLAVSSATHAQTNPVSADGTPVIIIRSNPGNPNGFGIRTYIQVPDTNMQYTFGALNENVDNYLANFLPEAGTEAKWVCTVKGAVIPSMVAQRVGPLPKSQAPMLSFFGAYDLKDCNSISPSIQSH